MSGFIHWYEKDWSAASAVRAIARAESLGLTLATPETRKTALADRLALTESKLETLEYQVRADQHLYCGIRRVDNDIVVQEFDFYELSATDCHDLFSGIVQLFNQDHQNTVGFIADRTGISSEVEWDDVVLGKATIVTTRPDILALPTSTINSNHPELQGLLSRRLRKLSVYRGNELADRFSLDEAE